MLGDDKYGDFALNRVMVARGVRRLFLHAARIAFVHPASGKAVRFESALPPDMQAFLDASESAHAA